MTGNGLTLDFAAGKPPLAYCFRSAAFLAPGQGDDLSVPVSVLCDWIDGLDSWYKESLGLAEGRNLHLLYHREFSLVGNDLISAAGRLKAFGQTAYRLGFGASVTVDLVEAMVFEDTFHDLIRGGLYNQVVFRVLDSGGPVNGDATAFIERVIEESNVGVGFIAPVQALRDIGLLDSPVFNRSDMTIIPVGGLLVDAATVPPNPVAPCLARLRLYVDEGGFIYPCLGLVGVPGAELGSVYDEFEDTALGGRPYPLDLTRLAMSGPCLREPASGERLSGLPWICERHRMAVLGAG